MSNQSVHNWPEANQQYLMAALAVVREVLELHAAHLGNGEVAARAGRPEPGAAQQLLDQVADYMPAPAALDTLSSAFNLSLFETGILLLCAGIELDASFAPLCAAAQGNPGAPYPTFGLALAALPGAHWSALTPAAPLRRWGLIEVGGGLPLTTGQLRINERVLHYLTGISYLDLRLQGIVKPLAPNSTELPDSHQSMATRISNIWSGIKGGEVWPVIMLCGSPGSGRSSIALSACAARGIRLHRLQANDIPGAAAERETLARLWEREATLTGSALLIHCDHLNDDLHPVLQLIETVEGLVLVAAPQPLGPLDRPSLSLDVAAPGYPEQLDLWCRALGPVTENVGLHPETLVAQFKLSPRAIQAAGRELLAAIASGNDNSSPLDAGQLLWDTCRAHSRPHLGELAQRIRPAAGWDDLILPVPQLQVLREIAVHVRQRYTVYEKWGFAAKGSRGLGISALFAGASGTGKTMAAEVLANELRLDLYRIDLSAVVSKYIGETEKNLRRVFDAAEEGGAVLLFDEADALFGRRSEVQDSHDRYANIEISYLLQRMEEYQGLAVLTTNLKAALDNAFLRRIRFTVQFPFPDHRQRAEIWRRIFPPGTPTQGLDFDQLARLNVAGGSIRNIALNAAFLAADAGKQLDMGHLLQAARSEYTKLERPLGAAEIGGWV